MAYILTLLPVVVTLVSLRLYRRDGKRMQRFYLNMTFGASARVFFTFVIVESLFMFNFLYLLTYGITWSLYVSSALPLLAFIRKFDEWTFFKLQKRTVLGGMMLSTLILGCNTVTWPIGFTLYVTLLASFFYPSEKLLRRLSDPSEFTKLAANPPSAIKDYYSV